MVRGDNPEVGVQSKASSCLLLVERDMNRFQHISSAASVGRYLDQIPLEEILCAVC